MRARSTATAAGPRRNLRSDCGYGSGVKMFNMLSAAISEIPRLVPLMRDARVPLWSKIVAGLIAILIVSPLDLLGDIPVLGFIDDATLLLFVLHAFVNFAERNVERTFAATATLAE